MSEIIVSRIIVEDQNLGKKIDLLIEHLIKKGVMTREEKSEIVIESKQALDND